MTGMTGMRVTKRYSNYVTDACNTVGYGQAEDYTLLIGSPLTIQLNRITALNESGVNRIDWSTLSENRGDYFELERSADGNSFTSIYATEARGIASVYSYHDRAPFIGSNYYRLKMTDASGNIVFSNTVNAYVRGANAPAVAVYPNPVQNILTVAVYGTGNNDATLTITDMAGKVVKKIQVLHTKTEIELGNMASGIYLLHYKDDACKQTIKLNKK